MRFRMVMIAHPGPGIGFHKRFMWWIIIPPTAGKAAWGVSNGKSPVVHHMNLGYPITRTMTFQSWACPVVPQDIWIFVQSFAHLRSSWISMGSPLPTPNLGSWWGEQTLSILQIVQDQYIIWGGWHWTPGVIVRVKVVMKANMCFSQFCARFWMVQFSSRPTALNVVSE